MTTMVAPDAVAEAQAAGVGATLEIALGGVRDVEFSAPPLPITCVVESLFDAKFYIEEGHCAGMDNDLGRGATLRITSHDGVATNVAVVCTTGIGESKRTLSCATFHFIVS
jgi:microcystin degradation protein MlrC|eukprot:COSAG06_NODE_7046_length_2659_cov_1.773047_2_plen_111_part_00